MQAATSASILPTSTPVININDLVNGAGDWQNIQDIVREAFKSMSDQLKRQNGQMLQMFQQIQVLKRDLDSKANLEAIQNAVLQEEHTASVINTTLEDFAAIKTALKSKADVSFVVDALKAKTSRSDVSACIPKHLEQIKFQVQELHDRLDDHASGISTIKTCVQSNASRLREASANDTSSVSMVQRVKNIEKELRHIVTAVDQKAEIDVVNKCLETKANKNTVAAALSKRSKKTRRLHAQIHDVKQCLASHEAVLSSSSSQNMMSSFRGRLLPSGTRVRASDGNNSDVLINTILDELDRHENLLQKSSVTKEEKEQKSNNHHIEEEDKLIHQIQHSMNSKFTELRHKTEDLSTDLQSIYDAVKEKFNEIDASVSLTASHTDELLKTTVNLSSAVKSLQTEKADTKEVESLISKSTDSMKTFVTSAVEEVHDRASESEKTLENLSVLTANVTKHLNAINARCKQNTATSEENLHLIHRYGAVTSDRRVSSVVLPLRIPSSQKRRPSTASSSSATAALNDEEDVEARMRLLQLEHSELNSLLEKKLLAKGL